MLFSFVLLTNSRMITMVLAKLINECFDSVQQERGVCALVYALVYTES